MKMLSQIFRYMVLTSLCIYAGVPCYAAKDSTRKNALPTTDVGQYVAGTIIPISIKGNDFAALTTPCPEPSNVYCPDINNTYQSPNYNETNNCPSVCYVRRVLKITTANGIETIYPPTPAFPITSPAGPGNPITKISVVHDAVCPPGYVAEAMYNPDWDIQTIKTPEGLPYPIPDIETLESYINNGYPCQLVSSTTTSTNSNPTTCFEYTKSYEATYSYLPAFVAKSIPFNTSCPDSTSSLNDYYGYMYCKYNNNDPIEMSNASTAILNLADVHGMDHIYIQYANNGVGMFTDISANYYNAGGHCTATYGTGNVGQTSVANKNNICYLSFQAIDSNNQDILQATNYTMGVTCKNHVPTFAAIAYPYFAYFQCARPAGTQFATYKVPTYVACARVTPAWFLKGQPYFKMQPVLPTLEKKP